jgi:tetratricopeptide (TPR) repeat protein
LKAFDEAIKLKPNYAQAHYGRGLSLYSLNNPQEALKAFDEAIKLKPNYAQAHYGRGRSLYSFNNPREALKAFDEAIKLKPNYAQAHYGRGLSLYSLNNPQEALKALELKPDFTEVYYGRETLGFNHRQPISETSVENDQVPPVFLDYQNFQNFNNSFPISIQSNTSPGMTEGKENSDNASALGALLSAVEGTSSVFSIDVEATTNSNALTQNETGVQVKIEQGIEQVNDIQPANKKLKLMTSK